jgi:DNA topoisomerase VI subunit B
MPAPQITRTTFTTSRTLEFFTERELTMQLGVSRDLWGLALLKELLDNALDATEQTDQPPVITVTEDADAHTLSVQDNGPGFPVATLEKSLDYTVRVSSNTYYVSPSRGQLGNACKCLWAAPYVLSGDRQQGQVDINVDGMRYEVQIRVDHIAQKPVLTCTPVPDPKVKSGTTVTIHWPQVASYAPWARGGYFYFSGARELVTHYALLNPHATVAYINGVQIEYPALDPAWPKWTPKAPTSPHWYTTAQFQALLSALLNADRQTEAGARLISDVLREFDGFSGSAAQGDVLRPLGLRRATLEALVDKGAIDPFLADELLTAMQERARPVVPKRLGVLGGAYLSEALTTLYAVDPETLVYRAATGTTHGLPYSLEVVCGQRWAEDAERQLLCGFNFTPALGVPFTDLPWICGDADVQEGDPVVLLVHVTCPRLDATDRGKTAVALPPEVRTAMRTLVEKAAEPWTKLKAKVRREGKRRALQEARERRTHRPMSVKEAAWQVMEAAYLKASNQGTLPANARQVMYAARPDIIRLTGKEKPWAHSSRFTQHLLPDFMAEHPELTADWDVVYDARGHFREPHTEYAFGIGTVEVRRYLSLWETQLDATVEVPTLSHTVQTWGPAFRYQYALFVEKEGFDPLLERAQIQDRFDMALMSTKGMTVTAARRLIEALSEAGVTILVVHDFDKSGLEILHKFTANTRRWRYTVTPTVVDLGLRLEAALAMGLESEPVLYDAEVDPRISLRECGATEEECDFLVTERKTDIRNGKRHVYWVGERVELNAMDSQQFLDWLEQKLQDAGVEKVVPDADVLATAYRRQRRVAKLQQILEEAMAEDAAAAPVPEGLVEQLRERITGKTEAWDDALWDIVQEKLDDEEDDTDA